MGNIFRQLEDFYKNKEKFNKIIFYGAGSNCKRCLDLFRNEERTLPVAICVSDISNSDKTLNGLPIISLEEVLEKYEDHYILVTSVPYAQDIIDNNLSNVNAEKVLFFGAYGTEGFSNMKKYITDNLEQLLEIRNILNDELSKEIFFPLLLARIAINFDLYEKYYSPNQYFQDDIIKVTKDEVFLDIGAFTGDSAAAFINHYGDSYKKIICFEPDLNNYKYIEGLQKTNSKITLIKKGISNKCEKLKMKIDTCSSIFVNDENDFLEEGSYSYIELDSIDNLINEPVTFIKMDIEGFEMNALNGAVETIKKYRPKLAICIYHKYTDFIDIPKFILDLNLEYKFYVRHHEKSNFCETVLYAIPQ